MDTISNKYILPAEWHRQTCVQLTWPHEDTDWRPYLDDITDTFIQIAKAVAHYESLVVAAKYPERVREQLEGSLTDEEMGRVSIYECDNNDTWARDHAFITLVPVGDETLEGKGLTTSGAGRPLSQLGGRRLLDFRFNGWGEKFAADKDNLVNRTLYGKGVFSGERVDYDDFVLEGGSIESDGRGTVLTTSVCLMAPHRNQPLSREEIDAELRRRLRARRVVWINHGNLVGDDTDGHIDTTVRVAPHDTLLYIKCSDQADEHYADFCAMERELQALRTDDGRPYRLIALPMVDEIRYDDERLPATYANFLIVNGAVIYPTYDQPHNDQAAAEALRQTFPDHELIGIDSRVIIRQHGSVHCLTMQLPEGVLCR